MHWKKYEVERFNFSGRNFLYIEFLMLIKFLLWTESKSGSIAKTNISNELGVDNNAENIEMNRKKFVSFSKNLFFCSC